MVITAAALAPAIQDQLKELLRLFLEENKKLNLSAFRTEDSCWVGNILDSIAGLELPQITSAQKILDIGTGGGFPLLALAVCLPQITFVGLDATKKKIDAVQRIIDGLGLTNVSLLCGRTEELGHDAAHRQQYDVVTSRALAPLNVLMEYSAPFTKVKGSVITWKSLKIDTELQESLLARADLSCHLNQQYEYELPGDWGKRQLLVFEKTMKTPGKYPRATGVPSKTPLL